MRPSSLAALSARRHPSGQDDSPELAAAKAKLRALALAASIDPAAGLKRSVRSAPWTSMGLAVLAGVLLGSSRRARSGLRVALRLGLASASGWPRGAALLNRRPARR